VKYAMNEPGRYRVLMDRRWDIDDLYGFPRAFSQVYDFLYCFNPEAETEWAGRVDRALEEYPWQGGYSYVNLYTVLHHQVPPALRPTIAGIRYSSPGWMDLLLQMDTAIAVARSVAVLLATGVAGMEGIKRIDKARLDISRQRRQHGVDMAQLSLEEARAIRALSAETADLIGYRSLESIESRTRDPTTTLKILLAHARRLAKLTSYAEEGKALLPENEPDGDGE
jgi:hypothetical protein